MVYCYQFVLWENFETIADRWKKLDDKESQELKKIYSHYLDKRKEFMNNTSFKLEDFFGDVISKVSISEEQIT